MLHYIDTGRSGKNNLLFLHGLGATAESWHFQWTGLAGTGYRLIAPDLPGFGQSLPLEGNWTIRKAAAQVIELMDALSIDKFATAGLSMGGTVALQLASDYPERVNALILINTFANLRPKSPSEWAYFLRRGIRAFFLRPADQARIVAERVFPGGDQAFFRDLLVETITATDPRVYRQAMLALARFNFKRNLAKLKPPTIVISGERDTTIPLAGQIELARRIPGAKHVIIPDAGHAVIVDNPDRINQSVIEFLDQLDTN